MANVTFGTSSKTRAATAIRALLSMAISSLPCVSCKKRARFAIARLEKGLAVVVRHHLETSRLRARLLALATDLLAQLLDLLGRALGRGVEGEQAVKARLVSFAEPFRAPRIASTSEMISAIRDIESKTQAIVGDMGH